MTDVLLLPTVDGGELEFVNGILTMTDGLMNAAYLSLFGGNEDDPGLAGDRSKEWWANTSEPVAERQFRSRVQHLMRTLPLTSGNLGRVKEAAEADLEWMTKTKLASSVSAFATIPALNTLKLATNIVIVDKVYSYVFTEAWRARAA